MFTARAVSVAAAAALSLVSLAVAAQAATPSSSDSVVITATRTPVQASAVITEVSVLQREDIERSTGQTLAQLLSQQAGLQFNSNGGLGKSSAIFVRGMEGRHVLLLIDGVRHGSATLGTASFDNLPAEAIERIEIVRGPLSSLYGTEAAGGVIQIFTRGGREGFHPNAHVGMGSHDYRSGGLGAAFGSGAFSGNVQLQHLRTDGFSSTNERVPFGSFNPDDDGFEQNSVSANLRWRLGADWNVGARALASRGLNDYDDGPGAQASAKLRNDVLSLDARGRVTGAWHTTLRVSDSVDRLDTVRSASQWTTFGPIRTQQRQWAWENTLDSGVGQWLLLAERLHQQVSKPGDNYVLTERTIHALAVGLSGSAGAHSWQASWRHDRNSQFGRENTVNLGYGLALSPAWRLTASGGTTFIAPSFNQLYWPRFGNRNLRPEEGKQAEVGLRWQGDGQQAGVQVYQHRMRGYISAGPLPQNVPRARFEGVSLHYDGSFAGWDLNASADYTNPRNVTENSPNFGKLLPRRAQRMAKVGVSRSVGAWSAGASVAAFSHRFDNAGNTVRLPGYGTLGLHARWQFAPGWALQANLNNVTGKQHETALGYNQADREAYLTLRWAPR